MFSPLSQPNISLYNEGKEILRKQREDNMRRDSPDYFDLCRMSALCNRTPYFPRFAREYAVEPNELGLVEK